MIWLLSAASFLTADFRQQDPELKKFEVPMAIESQTIGAGQAVEDAQELVDDVQRRSGPSIAWRALGWLTYASCGTAPISVQYRQDRSGWTPDVENDIGNFALWGGAAQGSNMFSDWNYGNHRGTVAWMSRIGVLAGCSYTAINNFHKGWNRE